MAIKLRNGIFLAPFHPVDEDPTLCIQRDLELIEHLDRLGYDEAWVGEHHSAGYEIIASPELFIAAAAERTKRIMLGSGVISLPYHNPLMVANRVIQLDHQTKGRFMLGVGPGLLPSDAFAMGIHPSTQRDRMVEAIEVILRLFKGERVTHKSDWFTLVDATCQLKPYTWPHPEVAVASSVTPSGGKLAGKHGFGMLCVAATQEGGYDALGINWKVANDVAAENGRKMDPEKLRLVGPVHIAETRAEAYKNVEFGIRKWQDYFGGISAVAGRQGTETSDHRRIGQERPDRRRNARRCHRADPPPAGQAGRVRRIPAARAQLGEFRCDQEVVRALATARHAGDQRRQFQARGSVQLGARQQGSLHRRSDERGDGDHRQAQ